MDPWLLMDTMQGGGGQGAKKAALGETNDVQTEGEARDGYSKSFAGSKATVT